MFFLFSSISDKYIYYIVDILYVSDMLVIAYLPGTIWLSFGSFLIFCCYFTRLKAHKISRQNVRNSDNIDHVLTLTRAITNAYFLVYKKPLTIITNHSILDIAAVLDPPLKLNISWNIFVNLAV